MPTSNITTSASPGSDVLPLVQMMPKGLVTIPQSVRRQLGLDPKQRPYLRIKLEKGSINLEPVQVVSQARLRDYSDSDIKQVLKQDQLDQDTQKWVREEVEKYESSPNQTPSK